MFRIFIFILEHGLLPCWLRAAELSVIFSAIGRCPLVRFCFLRSVCHWPGRRVKEMQHEGLSVNGSGLSPHCEETSASMHVGLPLPLKYREQHVHICTVSLGPLMFNVCTCHFPFNWRTAQWGKARFTSCYQVILNFHTVFVLIPNSRYSLRWMRHDFILNLHRVPGLSCMFLLYAGVKVAAWVNTVAAIHLCRWQCCLKRGAVTTAFQLVLPQQKRWELW